MDITGATFWQNYGGIDIWVKQDIKGGTSTYFINVDGTIHSRDGEKEILTLARFITNARQRGK